MRLFAFALAAALLPAAAVRAQNENPTPADEVRGLEGRWQVVQRVRPASQEIDAVSKAVTDLGFEVEIGNGKLQARDTDKEGKYLEIQMDAGSFPRVVNLKVPGEDSQTMPGIYWEEEGLLVFAIGTNGQRPQSKEDTENAILVFLRRPPTSEFIGGSNP